jgi:hypothetical protein
MAVPEWKVNLSEERHSLTSIVVGSCSKVPSWDRAYHLRLSYSEDLKTKNNHDRESWDIMSQRLGGIWSQQVVVKREGIWHDTQRRSSSRHLQQWTVQWSDTMPSLARSEFHCLRVMAETEHQVWGWIVLGLLATCVVYWCVWECWAQTFQFTWFTEPPPPTGRQTARQGLKPWRIAGKVSRSLSSPLPL